jgi:hypothetical protein
MFETCFTLREEHTLKVFENKDAEENIWTEGEESCEMRSFVICTLDKILG